MFIFFQSNFLKTRLKDIPPDQWNEVFIAYDNICNIERMRAARGDLPFPEPYNMLWKRISKIIDTFHLRNHKREECHKKYNPTALKDKFHRILSSMPKVHNNFFLHRLIKRRNLYNEYCYKHGKKPLLPNSKPKV